MHSSYFVLNPSRSEHGDNLNDLKYVMDLAKSDDNLGVNFSDSIEELKNYNVFIVTVPTPIDQFKAPDLMGAISCLEQTHSISIYPQREQAFA